MIVVDTTVLVYAVGGEHRAREPNRRLVDILGSGQVSATTTPDVIQQFIHVFARRRPRAEAVRHARTYATLLSPLQSVDVRDLDLGLRLFEDYNGLDASDAMLAAVALNRDADALVSSDLAFSTVRRLRHVDPAGPEFEQLV